MTPHEWLRARLETLPSSVISLSVGAVFSDLDDQPRIDARLKAELRGADGATCQWGSIGLCAYPDSCQDSVVALDNLADDLDSEVREFLYALPMDEWLTIGRSDMPTAARMAGETATMQALVAETREFFRALPVDERLTLRAIVEGRSAPPTDDEIAAHRGWWRSIVPGEYILSGDMMSAEDAAQLRDVQAVNPRDPLRWWALDGVGRPCAWPVVTP